MATTKSKAISALKKRSRILSTCTRMKSNYMISTISRLSSISTLKDDKDDECCAKPPPPTTTVTPPAANSNKRRKRAEEAEIISTGQEIIPPEKALRIDMLKRRFTDDTIVKATHQLHGNKSAASCDIEQQEVRRREKLMAEQIRMVAEIRSASDDLKKRRERERLARENMKNTVEFNDQHKYIMRELRDMGCGLPWHGVNPLKTFGLFIKKDDYDYDLEEGEII